MSEYTILHRHTFETNLPGKPKREGDAILILGGEEFLDKLANYPEDFVFHINLHWRFTIRGGPRNPHNVSQDDLDHAAYSLNYSRELSQKISPTPSPNVAAP